MTDIFRFSPELALLVTAGLIVIFDALAPLGGRSVYRARRPVSIALALAGVAASAALSAAIISADEKGPAFEGMISVDDFSLFFYFLFAGVTATVVLASVDFLRNNRFQGEYWLSCSRPCRPDDDRRRPGPRNDFHRSRDLRRFRTTCSRVPEGSQSPARPA